MQSWNYWLAYHGKNGNTQGAVVRVAKTKSLTKRTANRMY